MNFPCAKCGLCCRHIDLIPQLKEFDSGDGRCKNLMDNNLCSIYGNRPDVCNVSKMYESVYYKQMSEDEYIKLNIAGCKEIKRKSMLK